MIRLLVILPLLFIFNSCDTSTKTDNLTSSQMELFSYLPDNTDYLFYADLDAVNRSKYGEESLASLLPEKAGQGWITKFENATGTGINKGIKEIIFVKTKDENNILLARFDRNYNRVRKYFRESTDFQKTPVKNIFALRKKSDTKFYIPGDDLLIASSRGDYIDSLSAGRIRMLISNKDFLNIMKSIQKKHTIWMATDKGSLAGGIFNYVAGKDSKLLSPQILASIKSFSVSAEFSEGAEVESVLGCSNAGNAYLLAAAVEGAVAMNILSKKSYKLGKIFDKMDVNREGKLIRFHLDLEAKELDELKQLTLSDKKGNNFKGEIW